MPTTRCGKVRRLLKEGKAKVVKRTPFTIQLLFETTEYVDELTLGLDTGSKVIGSSVSSKTKEHYSSETVLRNDIVNLISTKRNNRRTRRNRLRYRQPRFLNRVKSKNKGWLAPSIEQKINSHLKLVDDIFSILPIGKIIVETASFDIQKMKDDSISGYDYQSGVQLGFWNVREYVLFRDMHVCQYCKGKSKDKILNVHHIKSRKTGGDAPNNLLTLCETCHKKLHNGLIVLKVSNKANLSFSDSAFMGIMRWTFYNRLKEKYRMLDVEVQNTYGYLTKNKRIENGFEKTHTIDAFCIAGNLQAIQTIENNYLIKKVRCHNRQIHKSNMLKGGKKKLNQAPFLVRDFRLFDKIKYNGQEGFIFGRRSTGYFDLRKLNGEVIHRSASHKKLKLLEKRKNYIVERLKKKGA